MKMLFFAIMCLLVISSGYGIIELDDGLGRDIAVLLLFFSIYSMLISGCIIILFNVLSLVFEKGIISSKLN